MCCLFGFIDYAGVLSVTQKSRLIRELSIAAEVRGTDATGIAYNTSRGLQIYKRPLAAHRLHLRIPAEAHVVMGHTRMTTQGSAKKNYNNHPFFGCVKGKSFALAHNGIVWNDLELRRTKHLPRTKVQTDSFIAVQLIEQQKALNLSSLKCMAEQVEGSFSFSVLSEQDELWLVKGDNADTKNRTKTITLYMLIAMILMGLLAYLIYSLKIIYSIAWSLEEVVTELVVPMVLICVILNIAISIFWGSGLLLSDTNIDSVLALPIPLRTLILSKLTVLFMVEVALTVALLLPMMVLFGLTAGMGFPFYLIVLGITILFPVIPGLLGTMFGTQIYRILKNSSARIARLKAAAAILILFAFMIFMFCKFPDIAAGNFGDVISTSTFTLYAGQYIHRLLNGDYLLIGIYFGGVFLIGVTLLYGLIKIFRNWYSNDAIQGSKSQPVDWNKQTTKQHSPVSALLERERTRYFSLPVYLTNTACGLLFAAVFVLLVVLMSDKITPYIYQLAEYFQVPFADYDVLFIYAFSILTTISCTTYVSISIEGKQIEILKSLPIAAKCLFRVKLLHHLSMSVPTIFVLNTIMALYLQWSFPKAMLGYAFPLLCSVLIGMIGYILNLIFPNFEWENVTHIIKQSLPAILTALIGVVVTCGTAYLLLRFFPSALFMGSWLACAIILLLLLTMVAWVDKKGQHLYQEL